MPSGRSRPAATGTFGGQLSVATVLAGRGSMLTPIAAPIAFLPAKNVPAPSVGRIAATDANYALYRQHLRKTTEEPFALFLQG